MAKKAENFIVNMCVFCAKDTVFKDFIDNLAVQYIPVKYIDFILVKTIDNIIFRLEATDVEQLISPDKHITRDNIISHKNNIKTVNIFIDLQMLEDDVNHEMDKYLGKLSK